MVVGCRAMSVVAAVSKDLLEQTPCKKRRCEVSPVQEASSPHFQSSSICRVGAAATLNGFGLVESLALLKIRDIAQSAAVCALWRAAADGRELWALAAPRLGIVARVVQRRELSRRRSRGVVEKGTLLCDKRQAVALRTIDLKGANAGVDDGLLPSIVREVALLRSVASGQHPGIVRLIGTEILGERMHVVTEFVASSFAAWFLQPRPAPQRLRAQIRDRFGQFLLALGFLHSAGLIHRNLSPANVLLDPVTGVVKIADLACGRALDSPLRPYSPEDPKLRQQSSREARRLFYRAPELIMRKSVYGVGIDIWSVGCMLAEATTGDPLFCSESEVDHLFRIFKFAGTPGTSRWPEAIGLPTFSPSFPVYVPIDVRAVARAARGSTADQVVLQATCPHKKELLVSMTSCATVLGMEGMDLLGSLLRLEPSQRCTATGALQTAFFKRQGVSIDAVDIHAATPATRMAHGMARMHLADSPLLSRISRARMSTKDPALPSLWAEMAYLDATFRSQMLQRQGNPDHMIGAFCSPSSRSTAVDGAIDLVNKLGLGDFCLHLGLALLDEERYLATAAPRNDGPLDTSLVGMACIKIADAFDEHSQEYYQRERTTAYVAAGGGKWHPAALVAAEKYVAQLLDFQFHRPTAAWFLRHCVHAGGQELRALPEVVQLARFFVDLSLLDENSAIHPASLCAQAALLLAIHACARCACQRGEESCRHTCPLKVWSRIRHETCAANGMEEAAPCLAHIARVVGARRKEWLGSGLRAVERRHPEAANRRLPAAGFPLSVLVCELLPAEFRGKDSRLEA